MKAPSGSNHIADKPAQNTAGTVHTFVAPTMAPGSGICAICRNGRNHSLHRVPHTPGKWYMGNNLTVWTDADQSLIAQVAGPRDEDPESLANARLIAAAPELLSALKLALHSLEFHDKQAEYDWHSDEIKAARAAIAKAEGTR